MEQAAAAPTPGAMIGERPAAVIATGPARQGLGALRLAAVAARVTALPGRARVGGASRAGVRQPAAVVPLVRALVRMGHAHQAPDKTAAARTAAQLLAPTVRAAPSVRTGLTGHSVRRARGVLTGRSGLIAPAAGPQAAVIVQAASLVTGFLPLTNVLVAVPSGSAPQATVRTLVVLRAAAAVRSRKAEGPPALRAAARHDRMPGTSTVHRPLCEIQAMSRGVLRRLGVRRRAPAPTARLVLPPTGGNRVGQAPHGRATAGLLVRVGMLVLALAADILVRVGMLVLALAADILVRVGMLVLALAGVTPVHIATLVLIPAAVTPVRAEAKVAIRARRIAARAVTAVRRVPAAGIRQPASTAAPAAAGPSARPATAPTAVIVPRPLAEAVPQDLMTVIGVRATARAAAAATGSRRTMSRLGAPGRLGAPRSRFRPAPIRSCLIPRSALSCAP
jgi:hypothetical protein